MNLSTSYEKRMNAESGKRPDIKLIPEEGSSILMRLRNACVDVEPCLTAQAFELTLYPDILNDVMVDLLNNSSRPQLVRQMFSVLGYNICASQARPKDAHVIDITKYIDMQEEVTIPLIYGAVVRYVIEQKCEMTDFSSVFVPGVHYQGFDITGFRSLAEKLPEKELLEQFIKASTSAVQAIDLAADFGTFLFKLLIAIWLYRTAKTEKNSTAMRVALVGWVTYLMYSHKQSLEPLAAAIQDDITYFWMNLCSKAVELFNSSTATAESEVTYQNSFIEDESFLLEGVALMITAIFACKVPISSLSGVLRLKDSLPEFLASFTKYLKGLSSKILGDKFSFFKQDEFSGVSVLKAYERISQDILRNHRDGRLTYTMDNLALLKSTIDEGKNLLRDVPTGRSFDYVKKLLYDRVQELSGVEKEFRNANIQDSGFRQEPVGLLLRGPPGVQKSTIMEHFVAACNAISLPDPEFEDCLRNPHLYSFNRQHEQQYWSGYSRKANVVLLDDMGQAKDQAGNPDCEMFSIIRMINSFEYDLHMAEIDKKGAMKFAAKFVLATTNMREISSNAIIEPKAVARRFAVTVIVSPKAEYCVNPQSDIYDRKVDYNKIPKHPISGHADPQPEHFVFYECDALTGELLSTAPLTFDKVVALINKAYKARVAWRDQHEQHFKETLNKVRREYSPVTEYQGFTDFMFNGNRTPDSFSDSSSEAYPNIERMYPELDEDVESESQWIETIEKRTMPLWVRLKQVLWDNKHYIMMGVALIALLKVFTKSKTEEQMEYLHTAPKGSKRNNKSMKDLRKEYKVKFQNADPQGLNVINSVNARNMADAYVVSGDTLYPLGHAFLVKTGYALMPVHYLNAVVSGLEDSRWHADDQIVLQDKDGVQYARNTIAKVMVESNDDHLSDSDMVLIRFTNMKPVRDVTHFLISQNDLKNMPRVFTTTCLMPAQEGRAMRYVTSAQSQITVLKAGDIYVPKALKYSADTYKGDCGVPIFHREPNGKCDKIIAFHIAGRASMLHNEAFAGLVTREEVLETIKLFEPFPIKDLEGTGSVELQGCPDYIGSKFKLLSLKPIGNHSPYGYSKFRKSPINGEVCENIEYPAMLYPKNGLDPFEQALGKYCVGGAVLDEQILDLACEDYFSFLDASSLIKYPQVLTAAQALWGDERLNLEPIKCKTSAGYPLKFKDKHWKKLFLGEDAIRNETNPEYPKLIEQLQHAIDRMKEGHRLLWIFTDNLKDELRPIAKVLVGKTRLFNGAPFLYFVLFKMYFGAFMSWMFENSRAGTNGCSVTMNPRSSEWHHLACRLGRFSSEKDPLVGAGDFSAFDGSEMPIVHNRIIDYICEWYGDGPENERIRRILWLELTNSRHTVNGLLYEWHSSLPSGHPFTILANCMYNHIAFRYCWFLAPERRSFRFSDNVELEVTGDDNIFSVSHKYKDEFNELTLTSLMAKIGLTYTTDLKGDASVPFRKLTEVSYLKRAFRWEPLLSQYIAPLDIDSLRSMIQWTKKSKKDDVFIERLENFVSELSFHSPEVFLEWKGRLHTALDMFAPGFKRLADVTGSRTTYIRRAYPNML